MSDNQDGPLSIDAFLDLEADASAELAARGAEQADPQNQEPQAAQQQPNQPDPSADPQDGAEALEQALETAEADDVNAEDNGEEGDPEKAEEANESPDQGDDGPQVLNSEYDDVLVEIEVNGEMQKATLGELKSGGMLQADYTRKMQEIADQRRGIEAERHDLDALRLQTQNERDELTQMQAPLPDLTSTQIAELYAKLGAEKAPAQIAEYENRQKAHNQALQEAAQRRQQAQQSMQAFTAQALVTKHPELKDQETYQGSNAERISIAKDHGFTDAETAQVPNDFRVVALLETIRRQNALLNKTGKENLAGKKTAKVPKVLKPSAAQDAAKQEARTVRSIQKKYGDGPLTARQFAAMEEELASLP